VNVHFFSPSVCELAFTDYATLLEDDPDEARTRLEDLLLDAEALECYIRILNCFADGTETTARSSFNKDLLFEILMNGLRNISPDVLLTLALDGETLSELQCRVLEVDNPDSFWYQKQGTEAFLDVIREDSPAEAEENEPDIGFDLLRETGFLGFVYSGNLGPSLPVSESPAGTMVPEMTCSITAAGILETQTTIVSGKVPTASEDTPLLPRWNGAFGIESVEDISHLEAVLRKKLQRVAVGNVSTMKSEEVVLTTISQLWSLSRRRGSTSVSARDVNDVLMTVWRHMHRRETRAHGTHIAGQSEPAVEGENHSNAASRPADLETHSVVSDLEKSVLVRRFVQYKPVHQISRELGLNSYLVKEICERVRKEVTASLAARSTEHVPTEVWSTVVTGVPVSGRPESPAAVAPAVKRGRRRRWILHCLFWLLLGVVITALVSTAGRPAMLGEVVALVATAYISVAIVTPSSTVTAADSTSQTTSAPSLCL
jgi:hypothetical protein